MTSFVSSPSVNEGSKRVKRSFTLGLLTRFLMIGMVFLSGAFMQAHAKPSIKKASWGKTADGKAVEIYTLKNSKGAETRIITYGGTVVSLKVPDKNGKFADVVLGYDSIADYEKNQSYIGALIGRYANRIGKGRFTLDGKEYKLATNNNGNHLHGGLKGFDKVIWTAKPSADRSGANLELSYLSKDGEEGYPGNLTVKVVYTLTENDELKVVYSAATDQKTVVNLTQHAYFNLAGAGTGDILNHQLTLYADRFTPTDDVSIPTGELRSVKGTPFDFLTPAAIGARINAADEQLKFGNGYDHNWVLNKSDNSLGLAAVVSEPLSGRVMEVFTTERGLQFYAGNYLDGAIRGKNGAHYPRRSGFCLEAQNFPDSPNKPNFPSPVLKPGETYSQTTVYKFSVKK